MQVVVEAVAEQQQLALVVIHGQQAQVLAANEVPAWVSLDY